MSDSNTVTPNNDPRRLSLRQAIIDNAKAASVTLEFFGQLVELRQPSLEVVLDAQEAALDDRRAAIVQMLINYTYVPDTDIPVFDVHDTEILQKMPFGKDMAAIQKAISDLTDINVGEEVGNSEEALPDET